MAITRKQCISGPMFISIFFLVFGSQSLPEPLTSTFETSDIFDAKSNSQRIYHAIWGAMTGPQTIFFWAPIFKWGLVIAGLGDLRRPAEKISVSQSGALGITGLIWTRYSLVIIPRNWSLFSVNLFVAFTAIYQITRALRYQYQQEALEATKATPSNVAH